MSICKQKWGLHAGECGNISFKELFPKWKLLGKQRCAQAAVFAK